MNFKSVIEALARICRVNVGIIAIDKIISDNHMDVPVCNPVDFEEKSMWPKTVLKGAENFFIIKISCHRMKM